MAIGIPHTSENFVGMMGFKKSEGKCGALQLGSATLTTGRSVTSRICLKRLINSVIPIGTKPNKVVKALSR